MFKIGLTVEIRFKTFPKNPNQKMTGLVCACTYPTVKNTTLDTSKGGMHCWNSSNSHFYRDLDDFQTRIMPVNPDVRKRNRYRLVLCNMGRSYFGVWQGESSRTTTNTADQFGLIIKSVTQDPQNREGRRFWLICVALRTLEWCCNYDCAKCP